MENDKIIYHQEHYIPDRPEVIRIIARCNGQNVGHLIPWEKCCNRVGELWVAERMRNKGIGKAMLTEFANYCKENNWKSVEGFIETKDPVQGYFEKLSRSHPIAITQFTERFVLIAHNFTTP